VFSFPQISPSRPCMYISCLPYVLHAPPISFFLIWHPNNIRWGVENIKLLVMYSSPLPADIASLLPIYLPQHPVSWTSQSCFSLNVRYQVPHPYKTNIKQSTTQTTQPKNWPPSVTSSFTVQTCVVCRSDNWQTEVAKMKQFWLSGCFQISQT